jgi:hypothetical protein
MYKQIFIIIALLFAIKAQAQIEKIETEWIKSDSIFIGNAISAYRQEPTSLFAFLSDKTNEKTNLGFNYFLIEGSNGKGYVSFFYKFILYKNKVVSYKIDAQMPRDIRLVSVYKKFYSPLFKFEDDRAEALYFGYEGMTEPIEDVNIYSANKNIQFFMTPYCGVRYGDHGGGPIANLSNRQLYNAIKSIITPDICRLLLFSKNPATRLYATEYYYQHKKMFEKITRCL